MKASEEVPSFNQPASPHRQSCWPAGPVSLLSLATHSTMSLQATQAAARITIGYCGVYATTLLNQVVTKKRLSSEAQAQGQIFDRYKSPGMFPCDRLTANFLEWMPCFLLPLWCMAATGTLSDGSIKAAWTYVGLRAGYVGLVCYHGVNTGGYNKPLWIFTLPGYGCLLYLFVSSIMAVF